jgi:hypothetical protein
MEDEPKVTVEDLLAQLQAPAASEKRIEETRPPLCKEDLEDFVIQKSSTLVDETLNMITNVRDYITSAPESKDVSSMAELINAASSAIETLNKIVISNKKNETSLKVKEMDVTTKKELHTAEENLKVSLKREEIFKMLFKQAKPIEGQVVENKQLEN